MLQGDLYTIQTLKKEANAASAILTLNSRHAVFEGHFPGRPVLPGACQLQMVKEIVQQIFNADIQLVKAHQLKFLSLINPNEVGVLQMDLQHSKTENNEIAVTATLLNNHTTCFKFNGIFSIGVHDAW